MMESNKQKRDLRHKREERWNNIRKARKYEKEKLQEELDLRLPPLKNVNSHWVWINFRLPPFLKNREFTLDWIWNDFSLIIFIVFYFLLSQRRFYYIFFFIINQ